MDLPKIKLNATREERLSKYDKPDQVVSSYDYKKWLEEEKQKPVLSFFTGWNRLDSLTKGFESGELIVISGFTGMGKTSFCESLTNRFCKKEYKTLWFSYEVSPRQFLKKFGSTLPLFYIPKEIKGSEMEWLEDRIIESKIKFDTRIIFIDHLHYLVDLTKMRNPSLEFGGIVRSLKQMAIRHNLVIFLVTHTSMPKGDSHPELGSLRDSSFITQEADSVMVIQRERVKEAEKFGVESTLYILKHRREGLMNEKIKLVYQDDNFDEWKESSAYDWKKEAAEDKRINGGKEPEEKTESLPWKKI